MPFHPTLRLLWSVSAVLTVCLSLPGQVPVKSTLDTTGITLLTVELNSDDAAATVHAKKLIQDRLREVFHGSGRYHWVERDPKLLEGLLRELKWQHSGMVDEKQIKELGRLDGVGVFALASGDLTMTLTGCTLALKVRLIEVESARTVAIHEVRTKGRFRVDPSKSAEDAILQAAKALAIKLQTTPASKEHP